MHNELSAPMSPFTELAKLVNTDLSKGFTVSKVAEKHIGMGLSRDRAAHRRIPRVGAPIIGPFNPFQLNAKGIV